MYVPSSRYAVTPLRSRCCSSAVATVDLPDADSPVSHSVSPCWPLRLLRSSRVRPSCQVIFLRRRVQLRDLAGRRGGSTNVAIIATEGGFFLLLLVILFSVRRARGSRFGADGTTGRGNHLACSCVER